MPFSFICFEQQFISEGQEQLHRVVFTYTKVFGTTQSDRLTFESVCNSTR